MFRHNIRTCLLFSLILLASGCGRLAAVPMPTDPTSRPTVSASGSTALTHTVQRGKVVETLDFDGRVTPVREEPAYFGASGYVGRVHVKQGDTVRAGDLLAELQADKLLNEIAQAKIALDAAQRKLTAIKESLQQEIAQAELNLEMAQVRLDQANNANADAIDDAELSLALAEEELAYTSALQATRTAAVVCARVRLERAQAHMEQAEAEYQGSLARSWEPQATRDAYARGLQEAQSDLEIAEAEFNGASADQAAHQHDLKGKEIAVEQARTALARLKKSESTLLTLGVQQAEKELNWLRVGGDPSSASVTYQTQLALVEQARLALGQLQDQLVQTQIIAPMDGIVASLAIRPGSPIEPFRTAMVIADPMVEVSAGLTEEQLERLIEGQQVALVLSTDPDYVQAAHIRCLPYPYGKCSRDTSIGIGQTAYISLDGDPGNAQLGTLAHGTVVLDEKDDVLWLPSSALRSFQGRDFVLVEEGGRQRRVDIELGIVGQERVEVAKGLNEGQVVVMP